MKYFLNSGSREFEMEVATDPNGEHVVRLADGRELRAGFGNVDGCQHTMLLDGRAYAVSIEEDPDTPRALRVSIAGESFFVVAQDERQKAADELAGRGRSKAETIKASMPGILVAVSVAPGDVVEPGQSVCVLEAMKMQNEVVAQHGGVVAEVLVAEGDTVDGNQPLVKLEPQDED